MKIASLSVATPTSMTPWQRLYSGISEGSLSLGDLGGISNLWD